MINSYEDQFYIIHFGKYLNEGINLFDGNYKNVEIIFGFRF